MQDSNPGSQTSNRQQTDCSLTNRLQTVCPLSRIKLWNLNSTACAYDQRAFNPLDPITSWLSHLRLEIYMFAVVNFHALAQESDIRIERRQIIILCWMQDSNPRSQIPNRQQTEWQTDWAIEDQSIKLELELELAIEIDWLQNLLKHGTELLPGSVWHDGDQKQ